LQTKTPRQIYGNLFSDLHMSGIWADGKLLSDALPKYKPEVILAKYRTQKSEEGFSLKQFFEDNFEISGQSETKFTTDKTLSAEEHIKSLWSVLLRPEDRDVDGSSLVPLPFPYIVPGGRFNEIYYWDSYFTMLGLRVHDMTLTIESMVDNFAWLIHEFGFIPNGNRTYFLGRSQPPFFSLMVELLSEKMGLVVLTKYKSSLVKEYEFWMDANHETAGHKIALTDGILNRYHDKSALAREEMYKDDMTLANDSNRSEDDLFCNVRAACESGWDFSSRWFSDFRTLGTIQCSDILPVDLNCLLYALETLLAKAYAREQDHKQMQVYMDKAEKRRLLIQQYFWNEELGFFSDYNFRTEAKVDHLNLAGCYPLYFKLATNEQAALVAKKIKSQFLKEGGIITTTIHSGQQWDAPNGWAPLQWMTIIGLDNYGHIELAKDIATRWVSLNERVYQATGKFVEKYNVEDMGLEAGGGEYPVQDGFGWSNGVYLAMKKYLEDKV